MSVWAGGGAWLGTPACKSLTLAFTVCVATVAHLMIYFRLDGATQFLLNKYIRFFFLYPTHQLNFKPHTLIYLAALMQVYASCHSTPPSPTDLLPLSQRPSLPIQTSPNWPLPSFLIRWRDSRGISHISLVFTDKSASLGMPRLQLPIKRQQSPAALSGGREARDRKRRGAGGGEGREGEQTDRREEGGAAKATT